LTNKLTSTLIRGLVWPDGAAVSPREYMSAGLVTESNMVINNGQYSLVQAREKPYLLR